MSGGNAEQAFLTRMRDCMFDFRLDDGGQIELANIGEATHDRIMKIARPGTSAAWQDGLADSCIRRFRPGSAHLPAARSFAFASAGPITLSVSAASSRS
jgi:hypothetical protein